jgi:hypothetical protein
MECYSGFHRSKIFKNIFEIHRAEIFQNVTTILDFDSASKNQLFNEIVKNFFSSLLLENDEEVKFEDLQSRMKGVSFLDLNLEFKMI